MLVLAGGGMGPGYSTGVLDDVVSRASVVYVETYTSPGSEWLVEYARRLAGGRVRVASRSDLEEGAPRVVEEARRGLVVVLAPGDPLVATTHVSLLLEASRRGVEWRVIPGVSGVVAAMAASGLQFYRFGRTATIPGPWRGVRAYSLVDYIYCNLSCGLHTLLLLDYDPGEGPLDPGEAARILVDLEAEAVGEGILPRLVALVVEAGGLEGSRVGWWRLGELAGRRLGGRGAASLVVPGLVHPTEAEALEVLHSIPGYVIEEHNRVVEPLTRAGGGGSCGRAKR